MIPEGRGSSEWYRHRLAKARYLQANQECLANPQAVTIVASTPIRVHLGSLCVVCQKLTGKISG